MKQHFSLRLGAVLALAAWLSPTVMNLPGSSRSFAPKGLTWIPFGGDNIDESLKVSQVMADKREWRRASEMLEGIDVNLINDSNLKAQVYNNIAVAAYQVGRYEQARDYLGRARAIDMSSQEVRSTIQNNLHMLLGRE